MKWTSIDSITAYSVLVKAAKKKANGIALAKRELDLWTNNVQSARERKRTEVARTTKGLKGKMTEPFQPNIRKGGEA
jgi:hypothetical protein